MPDTAHAPRRRGNLPAELSRFVDRSGERSALKRLLTSSRLVTITGVGGVGKTRTALRVRRRESWPNTWPAASC